MCDMLVGMISKKIPVACAGGFLGRKTPFLDEDVFDMLDGSEGLDASVEGSRSKPEPLGPELAPANANQAILSSDQSSLREFPAVEPDGANARLVVRSTLGSVEANERVEESVKGFAAFEGCVGVELLINLRERVEETPGAAIPELLVDGLPPLMEYMRDLNGSNGGAVHGPNRQVVGEPIFNGFRFIGGDALIERKQPIAELPNGAGRQVPKVSLCELGMLAGDFDLTAERQIVTAEHTGTSDQSGREALVMRIAQGDDPRVIRLPAIFLGDGKHAEVARSLVAERMGFREDSKARGAELGFHFIEQGSVTERKPGFRSTGREHRVEGFATDEFGSAVKQEPGSGIEDVHDLGMQKGPEAG